MHLVLLLNLVLATRTSPHWPYRSYGMARGMTGKKAHKYWPGHTGHTGHTGRTTTKSHYDKKEEEYVNAVRA